MSLVGGFEEPEFGGELVGGSVAELLWPTSIISLRGATSERPVLEGNRRRLSLIRQSISPLLDRAVSEDEWQADLPYIVGAVALLGRQSGPYGIEDPEELTSLLSRVDEDRAGELVDAVTNTDDIADEDLERVVAEILGVSEEQCLTTVRCSDSISPDKSFASVIMDARGSDDLVRLTVPTEWPVLFPQFWTSVMQWPLPPNAFYGPEVESANTLEVLDFSMGPMSPYTTSGDVQLFTNLEICLETHRWEKPVDPSGGATKHMLEFHLTEPADSQCRNSIISPFIFDSGMIDVTPVLGCWHLSQTKLIGYRERLSTVMVTLVEASCYSWTTAIEETF